MSDVEREREWWDSRATSVTTYRQEVWAENEELYEHRVAQCLAIIEPRLRRTLERKGTTRVLDLGCGLGRLTVPLAHRYPGVLFYGLDISSGALELARAEAGERDNLEFVLGDGRSLQPLSRLHGAYSMLCFQHLPHVAVCQYLMELSEKLVRGGTLVFQHVLGTDDVFLSHQVSDEALEWWCRAAGLEVQAVDRGLIFNSWVWVTARKP